MLDNIIAFSIKNKIIIALMTLALIIWGVWSATKISIDALPDITNNQVQIITVCPTLASQEVEQLVTYPIEQSIANLPDIEELRSISRFGLSVITVVFKEEVDIYFARQLINEKLKEAETTIPEGVGVPELAPVSTGLGEIYQYIIHPQKGSENKYSAMELRTMQDWIVARQLYGTQGIAEVNSFGGELKQYEVSINPARLLAMNITIPEIFAALKSNNENTGGAYIDKKPNAYFIRGVGLISSFDDIKNIVVKRNPNGIPILIKDVAEVQYGSAVRYGAMTFNGEVDAVGGVVMMLKGANSAEVVARVKEKMQKIQESLPDDVIIEPYLDRTDLVDRAIATVEKNLIEGALIVIFVLVLFLGNLRAGLIVASSIPLSMLFALGMMNVFGVSANLMSLGAIDFGLIVDGAVIIVEATLHHLGLRKSTVRLTQKEMDHEVYIASSKMRKSAAFGEIIILIVYIPILTLVGIEGKMFGPMAQTVGFAIFGALILSLTYIPMMSALFLPKQASLKESISDKIMHQFQLIYLPILNKAIEFKKLVVGSTILVFIITLGVFSKMGGEFIPVLQEGDFAFHCILPQGTSLSQSVETSMHSSRIIKEFDEVKMVVGKTGSAEVPTDPMPPEATDMMIILKPKEEWKRDISYDELADEMMEKLEAIPGVFFEKNQPIQMRFNELMTGIRQDVAVKIYGENKDTLLVYATKINELVMKIEGATEPVVERVAGLPQIVINYNRAQIAAYGLNIEEINHIVSTAFAGGVAGVVYENERKFDLVVRLENEYRNDIDDVNDLLIPLPNGLQIPLSQVANVTFETGPAQISREDGKRRIVVGFNVKDRDVESVVEDIQQEIKEHINLPYGYYYTFGGTFENLKAASNRLLIAVPFALALIFIVLYFTFNSITQTILIYTAIPMAAIGGVFSLLWRDMPFSISAGVGFIALFGVAVLNGIVLISTFNSLEKEGESDMLKRVIEGTKMRLRPVLMTATVASLGFLPMALSQSAGAEVQRPLATVVIGGLISATMLTLFVLPLLYMMFSKKQKFNKKIITLTLLVTISGYNFTNAQTSVKSISLDDAIDVTLKNNLALQAAELNVNASQKKKITAFELPKTNFNYQYGQLNSLNNDNSFEVSQSIPFPTFFIAKASLYQEELKVSELRQQVTINEIKAQVKSQYWQLQYLIKVNKELHLLDSLFTDFVNMANLRYQLGETNLLEKTTAETKRGQLKLLLNQFEKEYNSTYNNLKSIMNEKEEFNLVEQDELNAMLMVNYTENTSIKEIPAVQLKYQEVIIAQKNKNVEIATALPEFTVGYTNHSIIGQYLVNGTEVYFDNSKRFTGISFGLNIPLTLFSNAAKIKSMSLTQKAIQKEADYYHDLHDKQIKNELLQITQLQAEISHFKEIALPNAAVILNTALVEFKNGEINYMEYLYALQTVTETRLNHLATLNQLNQSIVKYNYLRNQ